MSVSTWLIPTALATALLLIVPSLADELHDAALSGDLLGLESAVAAGADVNGQDQLGKTALHLAADSGNVSATRWLVESSADPNVLDFNGIPPLVYAVRGVHPAVVGLLISGGADVNVLDKEGRTALDDAELKKVSIEMIVEMLREANQPR